MITTLYKRSSTGAILIWKTRRLENTICIKFGQLNGKIQHLDDKVLIGKQNRTPNEQAEFQMQSLIRGKKDEGYKSLEDLGLYLVGELCYTTEPMSEKDTKGFSLEYMLDAMLPTEATDAQGVVKPMLSHPVVKEHTKKGVVTTIDYWHKVPYPVAGEPKSDGVRCLIRAEYTTTGSLSDLDGKPEYDLQTYSTSREGKSYDFGTTEIRNRLTDLFIDNPHIMLDGELYVHGELQNEISGSMRKGEYIPEIHDQMQYHVWDIVDTKLTYKERKAILRGLSIEYPEAFDFVDYEILNNKEEVDTYERKQLELKYEGIMLKPLDGKYEVGKRSWNSIKVKRFFDEEFEIIGYELGKRGSEDIVFIMKTKEGVEFKAKPMGDRKLKENYLSSFEFDAVTADFAMKCIIGKMATVKFKFWSHNGKPSHAQVKDVRDYE